MMKSILIENIETATVDELLEAQKAIGQAVRVKQEALQVEQTMELQALAQRYGLMVKVFDPKPGAKRHPKYRHPENPNLTWCGRGMTPSWFKALEQQGIKREDLAIPTDSSS